MQGRLLFAATACAFLLAYTVVVLGAFVRLSDAGLGCPDWPGCYGRMVVPAGDHDVAAPYAGVTVHQGKAWKEMIHRYAAGTLGTLIFVITLLAWRQRRRVVSRGIASLLAVLVVFQALLGMWTVTWLLKPVVVTAHLLGGMTILSLLFWLVISQLFMFNHQDTDRGLRPWVVAALVVLACQIFLGGWTSANYSALICPEFPTCRGGAWFPPLNFGEAFTLWRGLGINYDGGILDAAGRTAILVSHRIGALLTFVVLTAATVRAFRSSISAVRKLGLALFVVLLIQIGLGISNVVFVLPMPTAVAHNGVAALLLQTLVALLYLSRSKEMSLKQSR